MIRSHQVNFGKDGATGKVMGVILYVSEGTPIGDSSGVQDCNPHTAANRYTSWTRYGGRMTMVPGRVVLCRLAEWRRTQP